MTVLRNRNESAMLQALAEAEASKNVNRERQWTRPPGGMVRLAPSHGPSVVVILADAPDHSGGVGGWQPIERSGRRVAKWWQGIPDEAQSLEIIVDSERPAGRSGVKNRVENILSMGRPGGEDEPPTIRLLGDVPFALKGRWVLQDYSLGARKFDRRGVLRRQFMTLALERFERVPTIAPVRVKRTRDRRGDRRQRRYTTRKGDTLRRIAVEQQGRSGAWEQIREWNRSKLKDVDPDATLRPGIELVLKG